LKKGEVAGFNFFKLVGESLEGLGVIVWIIAMEVLKTPIKKVNGLLSHPNCLSRPQPINLLMPEAQAARYQPYDENANDCMFHLVLCWYLT
jgi:hypothetical protein